MFQSSMLTTVLLLCLATQAFGTEKKALDTFMRSVPMETVDKCADELGLTKEEMKIYSSTGNRVPEEKELCLHKCAATYVGAIKNGKINLDFIKANFPPQLQNDMDKILACFEKIESVSVCQDMLQVRDCF